MLVGIYIHLAWAYGQAPEQTYNLNKSAILAINFKLILLTYAYC
jgi:hypothetical protein